MHDLAQAKLRQAQEFITQAQRRPERECLWLLTLVAALLQETLDELQRQVVSPSPTRPRTHSGR